jgi:hypothetical protein
MIFFCAVGVICWIWRHCAITFWWLIITAFGSPVVPELKLKKPQTSLFFFPGGNLNAGTWF